jgi:uncharacterized iron-regulated membrane protein
LGLAPALLAATGVLMWWNRFLAKKVHHWQNRATDAVSNRNSQSGRYR